MKEIKKAGIVCCSNGQRIEYKSDIDKLINILEQKGVDPLLSNYIYERNCCSSGTPIERANSLMEYYRDASVDAIFDISGGDIANEILPYLDYDLIKESEKVFFGYSDLTTVLNAIYTMTGKPSVLYQVKNLVWDESGAQYNKFLSDEMYGFDYEFIQGKAMDGILVGGNIRCFLKLAGTKYFPDTSNKILFLEALSGLEPQLRTYLAQLAEMDIFTKINGVVLGTFTEFEKYNSASELIAIVKEYIGENVPFVKTQDIGHSKLSNALIIGQDYYLD